MIRPSLLLFAGCLFLPFSAPAQQVLFTGDDGGSGTLRRAINDAAFGATITFDSRLSGATIQLSSNAAFGSLKIIKPVTLDASGLEDGLTIVAPNGDRVFHIDRTVTGIPTPLKLAVTLEGLTLTGGDIDPPDSPNRGGAIYVSNADLTLEQCLVTGNTAAFGGGIAVFGESVADKSSLTLRNTTIHGNRIEALFPNGGGIYVERCDVTLIHSTLTDNSGALTDASGNIVEENRVNAGGGISISNGTLTLENSVVAGNGPSFVGGFGDDVLARSTDNATLALVGNNFIGEPDGHVVPGGATVLRGDPMLRDPADNGGPTLSRLPFPGSPLVDAAVLGPNTPSTDQRGEPRTVFAAPDIGAAELGPTLFVDAGSPDGIHDGNSWATAYRFLQDALAEALAGDVIAVAAGTYYPDEGAGQHDGNRNSTFALKSGVWVLGGYPGGGGSRDPAAHPTTLSGDLDQNDAPDFVNNANNAFHVLTADGTDSTALLDGFTITAGNADGTSESTRRGGGLRATNAASPKLANCFFQGNSASRGGAISNNGSSPSLNHCVFEGNLANPAGGAIINDFASPSLVSCSFQGNSATAVGGAIYNVLFSSPSLVNCSFLGNSASGGGAISNEGISSPSLVNCSFQGNSANGGGAIISFQSSPSLTNCILWNNAENGSISVSGASVFSDSESTFTYSHCLVQNWSAAQLGGTNNLDGTDPANNPRFVAEVDPLVPVAQRTGGDLRLLVDSPAINVGDTSANPSTADLAGNPRKLGTIDLGALEGAVSDLALLWPTDFDRDAKPYGVEVALGTDPDTADPGAPADLTAPVFDVEGHATLTFGRNPAAPPGTIWILTRSPTLIPDSFEEIYRFENGAGTTGTGIVGSETSTDFTIEDRNPPAPAAFYRFEALYTEP